MLAGNTPHLIDVVKRIIKMENITWENFDKTFVIRVEMGFIVSFFMMCVFLVIFSIFFEFHIGLVKDNCTTIDHLEHKRNDKAPPLDQFDVGLAGNWVQVFGENKWLWF